MDMSLVVCITCFMLHRYTGNNYFAQDHNSIYITRVLHEPQRSSSVASMENVYHPSHRTSLQVLDSRQLRVDGFTFTPQTDTLGVPPALQAPNFLSSLPTPRLRFESTLASRGGEDLKLIASVRRKALRIEFQIKF